MTIEAFLAGRKDVTRRLGWKDLQPGTRLLAVDRVMGFKPGQKARVLGEIEAVSVRRESLAEITEADVVREGMPDLDARGFVERFCQAMKCTPTSEVTRIEFRVLRFAEPRPIARSV